MTEKAIINTLNAISDSNILIIGDVILDAYFHGKVDRISPEAPVSILDVEKKDYRLGGAANVALNLKALGVSPILCTVIGSDSSGDKIIDLLNAEGLDASGVIKSSSRITSLKTRLVSSNRQLMRVDEERVEALNREDEQRLSDLIARMIASSKPDAIIFEDYDKGVISLSIISKTIELARVQDIPVTVDPKKKNFLSYSGATLFKPNLKELREGINNPSIEPSIESLRKAYEFLNDVMPVEMALFTLSSHGMYVTNGTSDALIPTEANQIADVSGAGDTVIAAATCALIAGLSLEEIARFANTAAGLVCKSPGVVAIDLNSFKNALKPT